MEKGEGNQQHVFSIATFTLSSLGSREGEKRSLVLGSLLPRDGLLLV
jgi:hypothetical protein